MFTFTASTLDGHFEVKHNGKVIGMVWKQGDRWCWETSDGSAPNRAVAAQHLLLDCQSN